MLVVGTYVCIKYKKNYILCISILSSVYLVFLIALKEMDVPFTIYYFFIFSLLAKRKKTIPKDFFLFGVYVFIYVLIGLLFQERMNTLSVLLTRYGFLFLALLQLSKGLPENVDPTNNFITVIRLGTIVEVAAAIYILLYGDMTNRLAINNQAVGGSLSIGLIILSIAVFFMDENEWSKSHQMTLLIINFVIVVLSGTRGYMIMSLLPLIPFVYCYTLKRGRSKSKSVVIITVYFIVASLAILYYDPLLTSVSSLFRLSEGIGYRTNENAYIKALFRVEPIFNKLFGFGLGGRADNVPNNYSIARTASGTKTWMVYKLLTETTCHNYWYMLLFKQGILGVAVCSHLFMQFFLKIRSIRNNNKYLFFSLFLALVGVIISLTFRISGTCGIFEILCIFWSLDYCKTLNQMVQTSSSYDEL